MVQALGEKLEHPGPAEKERVASVPQGEKELVLLSCGEERIGGAQTLKNESEGELFREMLTST